MNSKAYLCSFSLCLLLLDRHQLFPESIFLKAISLLFLVLAALFPKFEISRHIALFFFFGIFGIIFSIIFHDFKILELFHAIILLIAIPVILNASPRNQQSLCIVVCFAILALCISGYAAGLIFNDASQGDLIREQRLILGFDRPGTLGMSCFIFWLAFYSIKIPHKFSYFAKFSVFLFVVYIQVLTGSRASFGCTLLSAYLLWENGLIGQLKNTLKWTIRALLMVVMILYVYDFSLLDLNSLSSGRLFIWQAEIFYNIQTLPQLFLGNPSPQEAFEYSSYRTNIIYHTDSFYVERFIVTGLSGLLILLCLVRSFIQKTSQEGRAFLYGLVFYGFWETDVFNLTSFTALAPLLIIAASYTKNKQPALN